MIYGGGAGLQPGPDIVTNDNKSSSQVSGITHHRHIYFRVDIIADV